MKFTKMSLVAALLVGSSAFAIDNIKMSGDAKLYYNTNDTGTQKGLFEKDNSFADAAINLNVTTDLVKNDSLAISAGASYTVISTLGLENNLVSGVWAGSHTITPNTSARTFKVNNANWMTEAWVAATAGKTTAKLGRMELDTPLVFTETWSIEKNTFEAAVAINQDIPDTTLVGAYVGNGNGSRTANGTVVDTEGTFSTYGTDGAYAAGIINNSFKPVTVQAWYYDLTRLATAYWLQADLNMEGILAGAQYTSVALKTGDSLGLGNTDSTNTFAVMLGYEMKDVATIKAAYSSVNAKGALTANNTATSTGASKLYTEAWWNYGYVVRHNTDAFNITVEGSAAGVDLAAYYTYAKTNKDVANGILADNKMTEFTATAGKSFGPLDATLAYVYTKADDQNIKIGATKGSAYNAIQAYLTLNF